jgi:hypothetical protein
MFVHPGLLASLLKIAQLDLSDDTRQYAATTIMDLASAPANQIPMAKNSQFLRGLTKMTVADGDATIRECAVTTLQNLAFPKNNRKRLVEFQEGFVLEALLGVVLNERNIKTRRRAGGALTNLVFSDTAERMARQPELLSTLATVSVNDESLEVQSRACLALTKIATSVDVNSTSWNDLLSALAVAFDTKANNNISALLRCKARELENRESLARHPKILKILAEICCDQSASLKDRDNATRALMHLANENSNRKIMCNEKILDALVRGASTFPGSEDKSTENLIMKEIHDSAIRAIARLATEISNRQVMAKHKGLIVTLAQATERECKLQDKSISSDGQQPSLGKPLLMSLLMAM